MPYGTDRMNDISSWKTIRAGDAGFSSEATVELSTLTEQFRSRRPVDGSVNTSAAEQRRVGGVDDRVDALVRDVPETRLDLQSNRNLFCLSRFNMDELGRGQRCEKHRNTLLTEVKPDAGAPIIYR